MHKISFSSSNFPPPGMIRSDLPPGLLWLKGLEIEIWGSKRRGHRSDRNRVCERDSGEKRRYIGTKEESESKEKEASKNSKRLCERKIESSFRNIAEA